MQVTLAAGQGQVSGITLKKVILHRLGGDSVEKGEKG
jgi:hypothetical protein